MINPVKSFLTHGPLSRSQFLSREETGVLGGNPQSQVEVD